MWREQLETPGCTPAREACVSCREQSFEVPEGEGFRKEEDRKNSGCNPGRALTGVSSALRARNPERVSKVSRPFGLGPQKCPRNSLRSLENSPFRDSRDYFETVSDTFWTPGPEGPGDFGYFFGIPGPQGRGDSCKCSGRVAKLRPTVFTWKRHFQPAKITSLDAFQLLTIIRQNDSARLSDPKRPSVARYFSYRAIVSQNSFMLVFFFGGGGVSHNYLSICCKMGYRTDVPV